MPLVPLNSTPEQRQNQLLSAARWGDMDLCHILIAEQGVSVDTSNDTGTTALHLAAAHGHEDLVDYLFLQHACVQMRDFKTGFTPLHCAVAGGSVTVAARILKEMETLEASFGRKNSSRKSTKAAAAEEGKEREDVLARKFKQAWQMLQSSREKIYQGISSRLDKGKAPSSSRVLRLTNSFSTASSTTSSDGAVSDFMSKFGPLLHAKSNKQGQTCLHLAAARGYFDLVELLLQYGAQVNARDAAGLTPLHHAANTGKLILCELLVQYGAVVDAKDAGKQTPLHRACRAGSEPAANFLLAHGAVADARDGMLATPLLAAVTAGAEKLVQLLLQHGARPNAADHTGWTPLHAAAMRGDERIMFQLLSSKKRPVPIVDLADHDGTVPLHLACKNGSRGLVLMLLQADAKVDTRSNLHLTGLHFACARGEQSVVQLLLSHGADPSLTSHGDGMTALHWASNSVQVTKLLCTHAGADLLAINASGLSLLHCAASWYGNAETVKFLLHHAPKLLNRRANDGSTPLMIAANCGFLEAAKLLLEAGARVDLVCNNSWTASQYAGKNEDMLKLLQTPGWKGARKPRVRFPVTKLAQA